MANEQTTGPMLQWDTMPEGDNMDFGYETKNFCTGKQILQWRGDTTSPIDSTVTALTVIPKDC